MPVEYVVILLEKTPGHPSPWPTLVAGPFDSYGQAVAYMEQFKDKRQSDHGEWFISELGHPNE